MANPTAIDLRVLRLCSVFEPAAVALGDAVAYDPIGGMQNHTGALTRALDRAGLSQAIVTTRPQGAPPEEPFARNATVFRVGTRLRRPRRLYSVPAYRLVPALARDADLVHVHVGEDLAAIPIAATAARRHRIPLVMTIHCSLEHTLRRVDLRTSALKLLGTRVERWGQHRADAVITLTGRLRSLLITGGVEPAKVHVIPSGVETHLFPSTAPRPLPELRGPRVVFAGRLTAAKGVHTLLEAFGHSRVAGAHLVFVGDGPERGALECEIEERGLRERVHVTGFVPHDEVPAHLLHADVLVLPSLYEEMGSILIEAMQAGAPIVASNTGGIGEMIRDEKNGLLVRPGSAEELAAAIDRVLGDEVLSMRLRMVGRKRAREFSWDTLAERVLYVYRSVLAPPPSVPARREMRPLDNSVGAGRRKGVAISSPAARRG